MPISRDSTDIVNVGGRAAGMTVAGLLRRSRPSISIVLVEPSDDHFYQPAWTLVDAGEFDFGTTRRSTAELIPPRVTWIKQRAAAFEPDGNEVILEDGSSLVYRSLVVAAGLQLDWQKIAGLSDTLGKNGVTSNYSFASAPYTWECIRTFRGGRALFTQPSMPIKCAGAPQKILYMAADHFRQHGGKTAAAVRAQAPVRVTNLLDALAGRAPTHAYDGYASCPLTTSIGRIMLAEFGYDGAIMPSFPLDPRVPRRMNWWLKRYYLPRLYWRMVSTGPGPDWHRKRSFARRCRPSRRIRSMGGGPGAPVTTYEHNPTTCDPRRGVDMKRQADTEIRKQTGPTRVVVVAIGLALASVAATSFAEWEGYERLTRETLMTELSAPARGSSLDLKAKNLSDLDLHGVDFRGADLSSSVFNGANLQGAKLDNANLTVAFFEHADLSHSSFRNAVLFSAQLAGANARSADFDGVRFIGDLKKADFTDAKMTHMKGAADMKNQSMGLMHTSMVNGIAVGADLSNSSFERAEFTFSDFSHAKMVNTRLYRADFSGSTLVGVDLTGADLHDALLIDADLTGANLTNADLTGANLQGVKGLNTATKTGTRGLPAGA